MKAQQNSNQLKREEGGGGSERQRGRRDGVADNARRQERYVSLLGVTPVSETKKQMHQIRGNTRVSKC